MKMQYNYAKNANASQVSPDEAAVKLRKRIDGFGSRFRHLGNAAWFAWLCIRLLIKGFVLLVFETVLFYMIMRNTNLAIGTFLVGDALLLAGAFFEIRKTFGRLWERKDKNRIFIGRSVAHLSGRNDMPAQVGVDSGHYIDYAGQPNHHVLINGSTSSGKTVTMLTFIARASLVNDQNFLMIDWNGENEEWARGIGAAVWKVPQNFKINLFKLNGLSKEDRTGLAIESLTVAAQLTALQASKARSELLKLYAGGEEPSLYDLWDALCSGSDKRMNGVINQRLRAIQRVIGYEPKEFWDGIFSRNNVVSLAGLNESEKTLFVYGMIQRLSELFDRKPETGNSLKLMLIIDEAWQFFKREREFDRYRESSLEKVVRLGRKYGFGLVVSTQQVDDVPKVFLNSCSLIMLHQQRDSSYYGGNTLNLDSYELAYLKAAAQGEMLLLDRSLMQKGQMWNDYVKVEQLQEDEIAKLYGKYEPYVPKAIAEPEMPIEAHGTERHGTADGLKGILNGMDVPSVVIYRFLIALQRAGNITGAYKLLKEKGWSTSDTTIYGNRSKPSLLQRAAASGYLNERQELTRKALSIIDPNMLIERQGIYSGNEEHKELMRRTIRMIQDRGNYAFTLSDKESFDVGELKAKMKRIWDYDKLAVYECQTNSIAEEVSKCVERARKFEADMAFVVNSDEIAKAIQELTQRQCIVL